MSSKKSILSAAESPVNPPPVPGSDEARRITVGSGRKLCESYQQSGPNGSCLKMCAASLLLSKAWFSTACLLKWKVLDMKSSRSLFQLAPWTPRTGGTGYGFWPTVTAAAEAPNMGSNKRNGPRSLIQVAREIWPTPRASEAGPDLAKLTRSKTGISLPAAVRLFPTPTVQDAENNGGPSQATRNTPPLNAVAGGSLNPTWVEWLMGFPAGWTACGVSETRSSRKSSSK